MSSAEHDMVILAVGLLPDTEITGVFGEERPARDAVGWIEAKDENSSPVVTNVEGVFAGGCAVGPKDIMDSITEAGAAASQSVVYLKAHTDQIETETALKAHATGK